MVLLRRPRCRVTIQVFHYPPRKKQTARQESSRFWGEARLLETLCLPVTLQMDPAQNHPCSLMLHSQDDAHNLAKTHEDLRLLHLEVGP